MRAVNLLPKSELRGPRRLGRTELLALASLAIVIALLAVGTIRTSATVADRRDVLDDLRTELAAIQPPPSPRSSIPAGLGEQQKQRLRAVSAALARRIAWDRVLRELSAVLPDDVWLSGLSGRSPLSPSAPPQGATEAAGTPGGLTIKGNTYSQEGVARLLARLQIIPDLEHVQLQASSLVPVESSPNRTIIDFTILADIRAPGASS